MKYTSKEFTLQQIFDLIERNQIDLNPSYQRNFIWSPTNQMELIDTVLKQYPLPSFFYYMKPNGEYEVVDGQQRTKTIFRFIKGQITSSKTTNKIHFDKIDQKAFLDYRILVILISELEEKDSLKEFYVLINKKGVHLNVAEVNKSEFHDTEFLKLADSLLSYQNLIDLDLFTETSAKRMNDRSFIEELLGYLISGIKDKKKPVEHAYENDITREESKILETQFKDIIDVIHNLNTVKPINKTRFRQKSDFYTLFSFIHENQGQSENLWKYQYDVLLILNGEDDDGRQFIRPSNDECDSLREYATNCVTQSNSKAAREKRLHFFNSILKNTSAEGNDTLNDVTEYFSEVLSRSINLVKIENYYLLNKTDFPGYDI